MAISVTYASTITVVETLANNTGSAPAATRVITHTDYNEAATYNAGTTPPHTTCAHFLKTLGGGTGSVDLTTLVGTNGAVTDGTGLKVQEVRIKNLGANPLTVAEGASNGHGGIFSLDPGSIVPVGGHIVVFSNDNGDDIGSSNRVWDLVGSGSQTSEWTVIMG